MVAAGSTRQGFGMNTLVRPVVGVSSCLLGAPVRYNGGHSRHRFLTDEPDRYVDWLPVYPEAEIGLGVPRPTSRLQDSSWAARVISSADDTDHSDELANVADRHLTRLATLDGYVLKDKSPSRGLLRPAGLRREREPPSPTGSSRCCRRCRWRSRDACPTPSFVSTS